MLIIAIVEVIFLWLPIDVVEAQALGGKTIKGSERGRAEHEREVLIWRVMITLSPITKSTVSLMKEYPSQT